MTIDPDRKKFLRDRLEQRITRQEQRKSSIVMVIALLLSCIVGSVILYQVLSILQSFFK